MACLVFVLCQPMHSSIDPSLHGLDFLLEIFLETCFCSFLIIIFKNLLHTYNTACMCVRI